MKSMELQPEQTALGTLETACHFLYRGGWKDLPLYYAGTLPFLGVLLYFAFTMSLSAEAPQQVGGLAWFLVFLFAWMKCCHARFASNLSRRLSGEAPHGSPWTLWRRCAIQQTALQPFGLIMLPLAALATLPFAWVYAYYQNLCVFGDGRLESLREVRRKARQAALLWPRAHHGQLVALSFTGFLVLCNWILILVTVPQLLRWILGMELVFSHSIFILLNTTFLMTCLALTFLTLDPLLKTLYVLRCFYGNALPTGTDLLAALTRIRSQSRGIMVPSLLILLLAGGAVFCAESRATAPAASQPLETTAMEAIMEEVLARPEFTWRLPKEKRALEDPGETTWLLKIAAECVRGLRKAWQEIRSWLNRLYETVFKRWLENARFPDPPSFQNFSWTDTVRFLVYLLTALILAFIVIFLIRAIPLRKALGSSAGAMPKPAIADLEDETVSAGDYPLDSWLELAESLRQQGENRLALRALFMATLACLGEHRLLNLKNYKSNRDYLLELTRRAAGNRALEERFRDSVQSFERSWYGFETVTEEAFLQCRDNTMKIHDHAALPAR